MEKHGQVWCESRKVSRLIATLTTLSEYHIPKFPKPQAPEAQVPPCQHAVFGACFLVVIKPSSLWTQNPFLENHNHLLELEGDFYLPGNSKGCMWVLAIASCRRRNSRNILYCLLPS